MTDSPDPVVPAGAGDPGSIRALIAEMRSMARVAGQYSVEGLQDTRASQAKAEAARATRWADQLAAVLGRSPARPQQDEEKTDTRVDRQSASSPTGSSRPQPEGSQHVCPRCKKPNCPFHGYEEPDYGF